MFVTNYLNVKSKVVFIQITTGLAFEKIFLPFVPELVGSIIVGMSATDDNQFGDNLSNNNIIASQLVLSRIVLNLVAKNKEVVLSDFPIQALKVKENLTPRKFITPFYFKFQPELSYIYSTRIIPLFPNEVISVPLQFFYQ